MHKQVTHYVLTIEYDMMNLRIGIRGGPFEQNVLLYQCPSQFEYRHSISFLRGVIVKTILTYQIFLRRILIQNIDEFYLFKYCIFYSCTTSESWTIKTILTAAFIETNIDSSMLIRI